MTYIEYNGFQYGPLPSWYTIEMAPLCPECAVWCSVPHGESRVYHKSSCTIGKGREANRDRLRNQLARLRSDYNHEEGTWVMTDNRIKGHEEIVIATGHHNPRDPDDWCYLIQCRCGEKDIAWTHEDARQAARQHRIDVRTPAAIRPAKAPRNGVAVPSTGKAPRQRTAQPAEKKPRRVIY